MKGRICQTCRARRCRPRSQTRTLVLLDRRSWSSRNFRGPYARERCPQGTARWLYSTTSKVFAKSFPTKKPILLSTPPLNNHSYEKYVAFSSDYIVYIHEFPGPSLCLILGVPSLGLDNRLNPPLHTPYKIIQYILFNQVPCLFQCVP